MLFQILYEYEYCTLVATGQYLYMDYKQRAEQQTTVYEHMIDKRLYIDSSDYSTVLSTVVR